MTNVNILQLRQIVVLDVLAVVLMYVLPTITHIIAIPMYKLEPMRCVLLINMLCLRNKSNAYLMALTLPFFSFIFASHPVLLKAILMSAELTVNVFLFVLLSEKKFNTFLAMCFAILMSKILYYVLKFCCIEVGWLSTDIVDTSIIIQIIVSIVLSLGFVNYSKKTI